MTPDSRRLAATAGAVVLALLVLTGLAFAFVPFHVGQGETAVNAAVGKAVAGNASSGFHGRVYLYATGPAADVVADGVAARLEDTGLAVSRLDVLNGSHDRPVVALRVRRADVRYNPVTPSAAVTTAYAYVASGNGTLADRALRNQSRQLRSRGDRYVLDGAVRLRHAGRGVYSAPGYRALVLDRAADAVAASLRDQTRDA